MKQIDKEWGLDTRLSPNFTLREMLLGTGNRLLNSLSKEDQIIFTESITKDFNETIFNNLKKTCFLLEIIRAYLEEPVTVTCGYRPFSWELYRNRSGKSRHATGEAADITFTQANLLYVYDWLNTSIKIGGRGINHNANFIHIDTRNNFAEWNY